MNTNQHLLQAVKERDEAMTQCDEWQREVQWLRSEVEVARAQRDDLLAALEDMLLAYGRPTSLDERATAILRAQDAIAKAKQDE